MELITILSTIILIATISTFILSIGAYILYKIRSRRELKPMLSNVNPTKAELVAVPELEDYEMLRNQIGRTVISKSNSVNSEREPSKIERRVGDAMERPKQERVLSPKFTKYSSEGYSNSIKESSVGDLQWK